MDADKPWVHFFRVMMIRGLQDRIPSVRINGHPVDGHYSILSVSFPRTDASESLVLELDLQGICVSSGSACTGGAPSHVMAALGRGDDVTVRFSLSKYNGVTDIDRTLDLLQQILNPDAVTNPG